MGSAMEPAMQPAFEPTASAPEPMVELASEPSAVFDPLASTESGVASDPTAEVASDPMAWAVEPLVTDDTAGFEAGPAEVGGLEGFEPTAVAGGDEGVAGLDVDPAIGLEPIGAGAEAIDLDVDTQGIDLDVGGTGIDLDLGGAGFEGLELETGGMEPGGGGPELDLSGLELEDVGFGVGEEGALELDGGLIDLGDVELIADDSAADGGADLEVIGPDLDAALLDLGPSSPDEIGEGDDVDLDRPVVTETMADLYARQGLHDRAAEVYRELLRGRPGDARLEAKLREVEGLAASRGQPVEDEEEVGGASLEGAWLTVEEPASVTSEVAGPAAQGATDIAGPAHVVAAVPDARGAQLQPAGVGGAQRTIGEYLHELLEFRSAGVLVLDESAVVEPSAHEPDEYDRLFDSPPSAPQPVSAASGVTTPGDAPSSGSAGDAAASDDDDEDLEMFRAWLQNLKR